MVVIAATTAGALKAHLEAQGLGISVYRDLAAPTVARPYLTVQEGVSITPDVFPQWDDPEEHVSELAQVDVWQDARNQTTNAVTESYTLVDAVHRALAGVSLTATRTGRPAYCTVVGRVRLFERDQNLIHDAITVRVRRTLA